MHETPSQPVAAAPTSRFPLRWIAFILLALTVPTGFWAARCMMPEDKTKTATPTPQPEATVGGVPLFATWPKDAKPEVAIVLTGQTYGYLSPCGCSRPQKGGLERRANFLKLLREKGWPVVALDLGDVAPAKKVKEQDLLKYSYTMKALREMGYAAVGVGVQDFDQSLWELLSTYTVQPNNERPAVLATNLLAVDGKGGFSRASFEVPGQPAIVGSHDVVAADAKAGPKPLRHLPVGVVSVLGPTTADKVKQIDNGRNFSVGKVDDFLPAAVAALKADARKPVVNVLLYAGSKDDTEELAKKYPDFNVILCQSEESEPLQFPTVVNDGKTFVIQVGHKGQNLGVLGVFKNGTGYDLKYQLVPLGEEFLTPKGEEAAKANAILQLLEEYTAKVKKEDLLAKFTAKPIPHEAQIEHPKANLSFVGSDKCVTCHPQESKVWAESNHGHAMAALEKLAERPGLRQFDGDCVQCHTVGFGYQTGYTNEKATPHLKHVGCENCHGPGSGHAANPKDKDLLASMSKWKTDPGDHLPAKDVMEKLAAGKPGEAAPVQLKPAEQQLVNAVNARCMKCHDQENDPKFDLYKYMPKIWHSGFKAAGLPGNAK